MKLKVLLGTYKVPNVEGPYTIVVPFKDWDMANHDWQLYCIQEVEIEVPDEPKSFHSSELENDE